MKQSHFSGVAGLETVPKLIIVEYMADKYAILSFSIIFFLTIFIRGMIDFSKVLQCRGNPCGCPKLQGRCKTCPYILQLKTFWHSLQCLLLQNFFMKQKKKMLT